MPPIQCHYPKPVLTEVNRLSSESMLKLAYKDYPQVAPIRAAADGLRFQIDHLFRTAMGQLHERAALAVSCLLVLLFSAILSMKMHQSMPLVVYFWSFLPAIVLVIVIHSGENMATDRGTGPAAGLALMWAGNLAMALALAWNYWRLARN